MIINLVGETCVVQDTRERHETSYPDQRNALAALENDKNSLQTLYTGLDTYTVPARQRKSVNTCRLKFRSSRLLKVGYIIGSLELNKMWRTVLYGSLRVPVKFESFPATCCCGAVRSV